MFRINSLVLIALLALLGCSGGGPETHTVTGTVTLEGQPVADAQIGFLPAAGQNDVRPAGGKTDANGRYTLSTYLKPGQESKGAMAGEFKVTVVKGIADNRIVEYEELSQATDVIPPAYAGATTTTLTATVTSGGNNTFDFELKSPAEGQ